MNKKACVTHSNYGPTHTQAKLTASVLQRCVVGKWVRRLRDHQMRLPLQTKSKKQLVWLNSCSQKRVNSMHQSV